MRHRSIKKSATLYTIGVVAFFSALHSSLPNYFNSSFLDKFTDEKTISLIYSLVSIVTILGLLGLHKILKKFGNFRVSLALILIQIGIFFELITASSFEAIVPLFILGMSVINLIAVNLDIFLQNNTDMKHTGHARGLYMTAINAAWIFGPLIGGMLVYDDTYTGVYFAAFATLFPLLYLVYKNFHSFKDPQYINISMRQTIVRILKDKDITKLFIINIVLQTFYAWMTVYTPLYLHKTLGFEWSDVSIILTIMLIPFVLIQLPLGKLADKKWGEKEILAIGFVIMAVSKAALTLFPYKFFIAWAILLFITRIGAAAAEIMIETYFFKKIDGKDPEMLSLFRTTRSLSYFIAPIITTVGLVYTTDAYLFTILGVICLLTLYPILTIRDTN